MTRGAAPRWLVVPTGALLLAGCSIARAGLAASEHPEPDGGADSSVDASIPDGGTDASPADAGAMPVLDSVDYPVIAHGGQLTIDGRNLEEVVAVEIGRVSHIPTMIEGRQLVVSPVSDMARSGLVEVVAITATARSNPLNVTVVHMVLSELNQQSDAGSDRKQFIEVAADVSALPMDGYSLVLYQSDGLAYYATELSATTGPSGLLVVGTTDVTPTPSIVVAADTVRAGPGAAVIHQGVPADYPAGTMISGTALIDGLVFHRSDSPESAVLLDAVFGSGPERVQANENLNGRELSDSIQRCARDRLDGRAFSVAEATPGASNGCDPSAP